MISITNIETYGWNEAIHGMRNSWNSWEKSDSGLAFKLGPTTPVSPMLGDKDLKLMETLAKEGPAPAKFRRMITVWCDILAPRYWWPEFDTYKVGTVSLSCSTMHTIMKKPFDIWDFSTENLDRGSLDCMTIIINHLNKIREEYEKAETPVEEKRLWWQVIQLLPQSYMQKRTVMLNYEVLANMYKDRRNHKLWEWRRFCEEFVEHLPYANPLIFQKEK